ncbi:hypothetical protein [Chlorogloeopsis fritschii]|nr:hypothetical protein [Chlorogloeopsis fritschii]
MISLLVLIASFGLVFGVFSVVMMCSLLDAIAKCQEDSSID